MNSSLFREASLQKVLSGEQDNLTDYIKTIPVKIFVLLSVVLILLVCMLIWIFTTTLTDSINLVGLSEGNKIVCYLSPETCKSIPHNAPVKINNKYDAQITEISPLPLSRHEAESKLKFDYYRSNLSLSDWNTEITITCSSEKIQDGQLYDITITKGEIDLSSFFRN